jgi:hypothetical protein
MFKELFMDSFVRGVGKTSGTIVTVFIGWQMFKIISGHDDLLLFLLGKSKDKHCRHIELHSEEVELNKDQEPDHEEINLEDMVNIENEKKIKSLFDKL